MKVMLTARTHLYDKLVLQRESGIKHKHYWIFMSPLDKLVIALGARATNICLFRSLTAIFHSANAKCEILMEKRTQKINTILHSHHAIKIRH